MAFYGSASAFQAYCTARGYTVPAGDVEQALTRSSAYIDGMYASRFPGRKAGGRSQELAWPRVGATDAEGEIIASGEVPIEVDHAAYEAALRELRAPGSLNPDYVASQAVKREAIGPISTEYFGSGSAGDVRPVLGVIDGLLAGLLTSPLHAATQTSWPVRA